MTEKTNNFSFEISLSVLNHLGRNLYRSFITVLGEAISNSWDADAENVWIYINKGNGSFLIKDDGIGMSAYDFQNRFLKIGYSKRKDSNISSEKHRPFIGRKGIGKLALLSCAEKIYVLSKTANSDYVGGVIDNLGLDTAIKDDLVPSEYILGNIDSVDFSEYTTNQKSGTIIYFENMKDGIRNTSEYLKKMIALYFRFALVDDSFNIYVDNEMITMKQLDILANKTQFLWNINGLKDPFLQKQLEKADSLKEKKEVYTNDQFKGFIASVDLPNDLKVISTDERISVDLFVNGRLREKDILKHIPTARIVENYLYGQIHFDELDNEIDRFTSSREGIVADDPKFSEMLESLRKILAEIINDWDQWRIKHRKSGDSENKNIPERERKSRELFNIVSEDFELPKGSPNKDEVDGWVSELAEDAQFNFGSYAECFISENLIRKYIEEKKIPLSEKAKEDVTKWRKKVDNAVKNANLSIDIRQSTNDISFLDMDGLAYLVDNKKGEPGPSLARDADEYKPIRDALMHTCRLTKPAKIKLTSVYENIKGRLRKLLSNF